MEDEIRGYCAELVDQIEPGVVTDWMELAGALPIRVGSLLIGLPDADQVQVRHWSDELEKLGGDLTLEELQAAAAEFATLRSYIVANAEAKRAAPGHDLLSTLLEAELDDRQLSEANVVMFAMTSWPPAATRPGPYSPGWYGRSRSTPASWPASPPTGRLCPARWKKGCAG